MHQRREQVSKKIPIPRKGTAYVARSLIDLQNSVPVVIAVRDMLKLARTAKEVKKMIQEKQLKINGKEVKDLRDSIRFLNVFEADKTYVLNLTPTGRFVFNETKKKERICKVIDKTSLRGNKIQLNLHDGSNVLTDKKISTQDTVYLSLDGKIEKHAMFEKGKDCLVFKGKFLGYSGKIESVEEKTVKVKLNEKDVSTNLDKKGVIVL